LSSKSKSNSISKSVVVSFPPFSNVNVIVLLQTPVEKSSLNITVPFSSTVWFISTISQEPTTVFYAGAFPSSSLSQDTTAKAPI